MRQIEQIELHHAYTYVQWLAVLVSRVRNIANDVKDFLALSESKQAKIQAKIQKDSLHMKASFRSFR